MHHTHQYMLEPIPLSIIYITKASISISSYSLQCEMLLLLHQVGKLISYECYAPNKFVSLGIKLYYNDPPSIAIQTLTNI